MNRISIALCTYNGSRFLPEQLDSIAAQARLPDEMVVCDDGSTDSTPAIVENFAKSVSFPIRFVRNLRNLGSTKNFEQAIGLCTGDLIALCDQDDVWLPEKLGRQAARLEAEQELGGVFSDAELINENSELLHNRLWTNTRFGFRDQKLLRKGHGTKVFDKKTFVTGATLMFRACLRSLFCPIPAEWVHDAWIAWMLVLDSKLDFIEIPLVCYRIHASQQIGLVTISKEPLLKRLESNRYEGQARRAAHLRELLALERRLSHRDDLHARDVSAGLRRKIKFIEDCSRVDRAWFSGALCVLRNPLNYRRYENGWKSMARDLATIFISSGDRD